MFITFIIVVIGWVFFRLDDFESAYLFINKLFEFNFHAIELGNRLIFSFSLAIIFSFIVAWPFGKKIQDAVYFNTYSNSKHLVMFTFAVVFIFLNV